MTIRRNKCSHLYNTEQQTSVLYNNTTKNNKTTKTQYINHENKFQKSQKI